MSLFNNFPYSKMHELNLDWLLRKKQEETAAEEAAAENTEVQKNEPV